MFSQYNTLTGMIVSHHGAASTDNIVLYDGCAFIDGWHDPETKYVVAGEAVERPANSIVIDKTSLNANGSDFCTISNVPNGAMVIVDNNGAIADGTDIELTFDLEGDYTVRIDPFPQTVWEVTISAY